MKQKKIITEQTKPKPKPQAATAQAKPKPKPVSVDRVKKKMSDTENNPEPLDGFAIGDKKTIMGVEVQITYSQKSGQNNIRSWPTSVNIAAWRGNDLMIKTLCGDDLNLLDGYDGEKDP